MLLGAGVSNRGRWTTPDRMVAYATAYEDAGLDSVWLSDHLVMIAGNQDAYPYTSGGSLAAHLADPRNPWYECLVIASMLAARTTRVRIGTAVMVLPQRNPIEVAKASATLDHVSRGRFELGVGVGWQRGEFEALGQDFDSRGARMDDAIRVMRACWTGSPPASPDGAYPLPEGVQAHPTPFERPAVPILIGGTSPAALRRAARLGDGWMATATSAAWDAERLREDWSAAFALLAERRADPAAPFRAAIRILGFGPEVGLDELEDRVGEAARAGFDEVVVDLDVPGAEPERAAALLADLRATV